MRRPFFTLIAAALVMNLFAPAATAAKPGDLELRTDEVPAMLPGEASWVNVMWRAKGAPVSDVVVTVRGQSLPVSYPSGRDHTSFTDLPELGAEMMDFTAVKIEMPASASKRSKLKVRVEYTSEGQRIVKDNLTINVPVREPGDTPWVRTTDEVAVQSGTPAWVHVFFEGIRPTSDFTLTATAPSGATVHYPTGRADSSLRGDVQLDPTEKDYIGLLVDPGELAPGTYQLQLSVTSSTGSATEAVTLRVS